MSNIEILYKITALEDSLKCGICYNTLSDPIVIGRCGHTFCKECLLECSKENCPYCKTPVDNCDSYEDKQLADILPLVEKLKQLFSKNECKENDENKTNEVNLDVSVINETPLPTVVIKPLTADQVQNLRAVRTLKPVQCKSFDCGGSDCNSHKSRLQEPVMKTPKAFVSKKRPLSSPGMKPPKRTPFRFSSPLSRKNLLHSSKCLNTKLFSPINLEKRNVRGETLLQVAVIKGDLEKVKDLLKKGANPNVKDNAGWTPLHEACNHGFMEITKLLVDKKVNINVAGQDDITPLHDAIMNEQMDIANYLVIKGADIYAKTSFNNSALDLCRAEASREALLNSFYISAKLSKKSPDKEVQPKKKMKPVLLHTALDDKQKELLQKCAELLKAEVVDNFSPDVTHVVTSVDTNGQCNRTLKILQGIIAGKWVVTSQWMDICLEYKKLVDEEAFEIPGTKQMPDTFGPKQARENSIKEKPKLFEGLSFYISGSIPPPLPPKDDVCQLIQLGGGKILTREPSPETVSLEKHIHAHHATDGPLSDISHYILYEDKPPRNMQVFADHICTVNVRWILDCICTFKLVDPQKFKS